MYSFEEKIHALDILKQLNGNTRATLQATRRWTQPLRNWGKVYGEFSIMNVN